MPADWKLTNVTVCAEDDKNRLLLAMINLTFEPGNITLLIGRNGAGKSTLLETMAGLRKLQTGSISIGGEPLWLPKRNKKLNRSALLRFGLAMQQSDAQWFAQTAREELLYSMRPYKLPEEETERRMLAALDVTGLQPALLERDPWTLSGGQQRRLALACLLACEPDWLLLDEPTAGLDAAGTSRLCAILEAHKAAGRGAVVATHDLDALLPLADAVIVVDDGAVREAAPAEAARELASAAPQALRAQALLRERAALPPEGPATRSGGALWPEPRELAAAIAGGLAARGGRLYAHAPHAGRMSAGALRAQQPAAKASASARTEQQTEGTRSLEPSRAAPAWGNKLSEPQQRTLDAKQSRWLRPDRFDPRALVLAYFLLTACTLTLGGMGQMALAACVAAAVIAPTLPLIRKWLSVFRAFAIVTVILALIAGISLTPLTFDWSKAEPTTVKLFQLMVIMAFGMPMLELMTPLRLQRAIQQTFGWTARFGLPIHAVGLLITIIFRFIPLLAREWGRFAKLASARGKSGSRLGAVPITMLRSVFIPYIRAILRLAEGMADALEARGYGSMPVKPTYGFRLAFGKADAGLLAIAVTGSFLLLLIGCFVTI
ncbi:ATP-binding cassette domain-containing protein [Paenibacillus nanensis]|uniref:ATP-binding cassette domain-containing protein n=1 Tax=Paenibacillus nanensis TaxID=393251 RepID=A0A3A1UU22_9BACL|nr:ATP-binding cassette domain-containing protein [Paenibacillus nanensis]RIX51745.1 ATP-binding cassette domain-containing protein [Paenibacillus nanensis]